MGAFFVMEGQVSMEGVEMDFLFGNPSQWYDSGCHSFDHTRRVRGEPERSVEVPICHVH